MSVTAAPPRSQVDAAVAGLVAFLESGSAPADLFTPDAFADLTSPWWRVQAAGTAAVVALRTGSHPFAGKVDVRRVDATASGFVLEIEERWPHDGQHWYCRELLRADLRDGRIAELSVYCTGDWDEERQREHAATVTLLRN